LVLASNALIGFVGNADHAGEPQVNIRLASNALIGFVGN